MRGKWRGEENATGVGGSERSNADVGPQRATTLTPGLQELAREKKVKIHT